jgi:LysM repeat protein
MRLNGMNSKSHLTIGEKIKIPSVTAETAQPPVTKTPTITAVDSDVITHYVLQGETLSVLAQKYHIAVGDIMRLNGMNSKSHLVAGEKIKIPSATAQTAQPPVIKTSSAPIAVSNVITHYVLQGETLYSISKNFGVTVDQLKEWNNLKGESIHFGQQLAVTSEGAAMIAAKGTPQTKEPQETNAIKNDKENADISKQLIAKDVNVDVMPANPVPEQKPSSKDISNGYFAKYFPENNDLKHISGDAMIFKTSSGWTDKKYYILTNEAPSGSIVQVTSLSGRSIYAKVLWKLEDMKLNEGLTFRISDAAASVLGITDQKFRLTVLYE